ncbi:SdiA-regulated domain-containing protein [Parendozoicomonas haliclonae]|uniref:SdiA-regulated n=2 Tax=Parendozoicomonas haliclonae TaxID=1960125 RepID=A0A1X7AQZ7_9GAMM|nr:SdiA-regulated [Parendozoicomonas haliclonae]
MGMAVMAATLTLVHETDADDLLYGLYLEKQLTPEEREGAVWLPDYQLVSQVELLGIDDNASGLTWNPQTETLFAVLNGPNQVLELSQSGDVLRRIPLNGFQDVEAITWIGGDNYVVADERYQSLVTIQVTPDTKEIDRTNLESVTIGIGAGTNKGFEGLAWDSQDNSIYVVRERDPMQLMKISGLHNQSRHQFGVHVDARLEETVRSNNEDLSGLHIDPRSGHLLVLSDESNLVTEIDKTGKPISYMELFEGWHGLDEEVPQAEGLTMDDNGDIYILSEPNHFYRFSKAG